MFILSCCFGYMSRDNSSGECIRLAVVTETGVERIFVPGNMLPTFYEG